MPRFRIYLLNWVSGLGGIGLAEGLTKLSTEKSRSGLSHGPYRGNAGTDGTSLECDNVLIHKKLKKKAHPDRMGFLLISHVPRWRLSPTFPSGSHNHNRLCFTNVKHKSHSRCDQRMPISSKNRYLRGSNPHKRGRRSACHSSLRVECAGFCRSLYSLLFLCIFAKL